MPRWLELYCDRQRAAFVLPEAQRPSLLYITSNLPSSTVRYIRALQRYVAMRNPPSPPMPTIEAFLIPRVVCLYAGACQQPVIDTYIHIYIYIYIYLYYLYYALLTPRLYLALVLVQ
jgi:hypothetical protein